MKKYFDNCRTAEELKKEYRMQAKRLHPDCGGNAEEFKAMQADFEKAFDRLKNVHATKEGKTYTAREETTETAGEFMDLINALLKLAGVHVEMCGSWIWITGETRQHAATLKGYGFRFSAKKAAWYYHREPYIKKGKTKYSLDDIRKMYGSKDYGNGAARDDELLTATA